MRGKMKTPIEFNCKAVINSKKIASVLALIFLLIITLSLPAATANSWQTEANGGTVTGSVDSTLQMHADNGKSVIMYTEAPTSGFTISLKVTAQTLQGFAIMLRSGTQFAGSAQGVNFEFGARDGGSFTLAWNKGYWTWNVFQLGAQENTQYTLALLVNSPQNITAIAYDSNGAQLANYTITDCAITQFNYVGFGVLESGGDYTVKDISINPGQPAQPPFVVPEYPLGSFAVLTVCFVALTSLCAIKKYNIYNEVITRVQRQFFFWVQFTHNFLSNILGYSEISVTW
jgi:hypothetical protein